MEEIKKVKNNKSVIIGVVLIAIAILLLLFRPVIKNIFKSGNSDAAYFESVVMDNLEDTNKMIAAQYIENRDNCKTYGELHKDTVVDYNYEMNPLLKILVDVLPIEIGEPGTYEISQRGDNVTVTDNNGNVVNEYVNESTISFSAMCRDLNVSESKFKKALEKVEEIIVGRIATGVNGKKTSVLYSVNEVYESTTVVYLEYDQDALVTLEKSLLDDFGKLSKADSLIGAAYLGGDFEAYVKATKEKIGNKTSYAYMFSKISAAVTIDSKGKIKNIAINSVLDENYAGEKPERLSEVYTLDVTAGYAENDGKVGYEAGINKNGAIEMMISGRGTYDKKQKVLNSVAYITGFKLQEKDVDVNLTMDNLQFIEAAGRVKLDGNISINMEGLDKLKLNMIMTATTYEQKIDFGIVYDSLDFVSGDIKITEKN